MNSYWIDSTKKIFKENQIDDNYLVDVCIIGAGICGLSTGYYLAKQGLKVIIIDKDGIGEKATGNTTAKITLQHHLIYDYLINSFGQPFALKYFQSNKKAISNIKQIIDSEEIQCDFEYQDNFVYTKSQNEIQQIKKEVNALNLLNTLERQQYTTNFCTICN